MHVPVENLPRYRALKNIADQYDALGNALSNIRAYPEANAAWKQRASWNARAQELRVPGEREAAESTVLEGPYIPCTTKCGAPEPCFGCDSGDYRVDS